VVPIDCPPAVDEATSLLVLMLPPLHVITVAAEAASGPRVLAFGSASPEAVTQVGWAYTEAQAYPALPDRGS